jgi:tetratricopeptide (TPR) repeat protein
MDPDAALRTFGEALDLSPDHSVAWAGRAYGFGLRGDEEEARRALAGAIQRENDPAVRARVLLYAAQHRVYGGLAEATELASSAHAIVMDPKLAQYVTAGAAWHALAELSMLKGDRAKGKEQLAKASTTFYKLQLPVHAIPLYAEETLLALMLEDRKDASERLQVLLRMAETTPNDALKCDAKSAQAMFEAGGGRGDRAHALLDQAQALARAAGDRVREATVLVNRAALDPEGASGAVREALRLLDEDRLWKPQERPLIHGWSPDWSPGIALDAMLKSGNEAPEDAFLFVERALARRLLLGLRGRDVILAAGLSPEQHGRYVAARADLVEARAERANVPAAEQAYDAMVAGLRSEAPLVAALAWPPNPPLSDVRKALRADEALVMTLFDPYLDCALVVTADSAVLRRATTYDALKDLLGGKRTVLLASSGPAEKFAAPAGVRLCQVPTASVLLAQRGTPRPRGTGAALLGEGPAALGAPVGKLPAQRLALVYLGGVDLSPVRLLRQRIDADTVVIASPGGPLEFSAAALLAAGAGNVVVGGRPPDPLDLFLDGCLKRQLPVAAAFHEAAAKGPLFLYGAPE